ncbi:RNA polymerase factor sigma-54 [Paenibacillus oryzisoli]|nr:RNA polymerase factor sigma-54 [Paenibacillus oryzisoli]
MFQQQAARMRITPQLRKAIGILKLSTPELMEVIQQEVTDNLVLEIAGNKGGANDFTPTFLRGNRSADSNYEPLLHIASNEVSLERHLKEQLGFIPNISPSMRQTVILMVGNLDRNGYLRFTLPEIAEVCGMEIAQVEHALRILQSLDPRGIGARDLRECLLLQVQSLPDGCPIVSELIKNHLKDIAHYHIHKLTTLLQVSTQEIQAAIDVIKELNPRPGAAFHIETVPYIIPEVIIERVGEQFFVRLHQEASSRLSVNGYYERMAVLDSDNKEVTQFLSSKLHAAKFFLKCLEQRRRTIFRVAQAIVEEQNEFFSHGIAYLKPMTLKQIAEKLSVHESTVSRATAGKYAQTPWGIFELKHFFPSRLQTDIGDSASSEYVKSRIKTWISGENPSKPHSDQKLADLMKGEGISISRRTITKYREELGISSSMRRKRI